MSNIFLARNFPPVFPNYNQLNKWPLQFLRTGYYNRSYSNLMDRTSRGGWWPGTASSATYGRYLYSWTGLVYAQNSYFRGTGFALRCEEELY